MPLHKPRERHRVTIRLSYHWFENGSKVPWKWTGSCLCGWHCLSWFWQGDYGRGALPLSLEHLKDVYFSNTT